MATKVAKYDLKKLVKFIESKHVAVPEFQRGFVWRTKQVKDLFDSLIKRYPVGSFIVWKTRQTIDARTLDGEKPSKERFLILDGQQRMTSLYYLCRPKTFVLPHVKNKFHQICDNRERHLIEFEKFVIGKNDGDATLDYVRDSSCKFDTKRFGRLIGNGYRFPVIIISLDTYQHAIEVFERINQAGTRISTESIFLSETFNSHTNIGKILRKWKSEKPEALTSTIDTVIFIHVFALIYQLEKRTLTPSQVGVNIKFLKKIAEEIRAKPSEKYNNLFEDAIKAVANAVNFLKGEYGIRLISDLPSQTMLTVLSVFFYYQNKAPGVSQKRELRRWFWRSSLGSRYIGSGYTENIGRDAFRMRDLAVTGRTLGIPSQRLGFSKFSDVDLRSGRSTLRNLIKQALWQQKPIFVEGSLVNREDVESGQHKPEDDHFFPYDLSRRGVIGQEINNILNIHFLNKDENVRKSNHWPLRWLQERIEQVGARQGDIRRYFESQLLPFGSLKDLKKYEKAAKLKGKARQREFARRYKGFLWKRFKLFEKVLTRLQNGHIR